MSLEFWFGLIFAIPVGILTNIYTPKFEEILARSNRTLAQRRRVRLGKEQEEIEQLANSHSSFLEYLVITGLKASFVAAATGAIATPLLTISYGYGFIAFLLANPYGNPGAVPVTPPNPMLMRLQMIIPPSTYILSQTVSFIGALVVITIIREAFSKYAKVKVLTAQRTDE